MGTITTDWYSIPLTYIRKPSMLARMEQLSMFEPPIWNVSDLTHYLQDLIQNNEALQDLWVHGEISNFTRSSSGHWYFTLKDRSCALKCVGWRNTVANFKILPRDGQAVEVHGSLGIYDAAGQYQLYVDMLRPVGEGVLFQEFLRLKALLGTEGLFDPARKRPIPRWPHTIGVVTSPTGAALRDIIQTIRRRFPLVEVVLAPALVQGIDAPQSIISALNSLNETVKPDVIIVARGGGSVEDLSSFNNEHVARAIVASATPVICGVGHETDFTIADFVADLRAPTPTAAAELATPNREDLLDALLSLKNRLFRSVLENLNSNRLVLEKIEHKLKLFSPAFKIQSYRQHLDDILNQSHKIVLHKIQIQRAYINGLEHKLHAMNPMEVMSRGYAIVYTSEIQTVHSIRQIGPGTIVIVELKDGRFDAEVREILNQEGS